jgi:glycerol-3-phosphate acyltransferase PlsX
MRIAVDAMGGDRAPDVVIDGAILAVKEQNVDVVLVGDSEVISAKLAKKGAKDLPISIKHAEQSVSMEDTPSAVLRNKRDSSIKVAFDTVKNGEASAVISAGNSGAIMVAACTVLRRLPGIDRPAIAVLLPTVKGQCVLLDAGANVESRKNTLVQFAIMGSVYSKYVLNIEKPKVALLSNGSEESKGTELTRETNSLLKESSLNYIGYGEGRDAYNGNCDVMICDGFVGNVVLKVSEGLAEACFGMVKEEIFKSNIAKIGAFFMKGALKRFKKRVDYSEKGGALLLGINGVSVIGHGGSSEKAIKNAILLAQRNINSNVNAHILEELEKNTHLFDKIKNSNSKNNDQARRA